MEHRLAFGLINGYLSHPLSNWSLHLIIPLNFPKLVTSLLVRQIFLRPNVQSILSIFFSSYLPQDQLVWTYTPKEKFTVRSAYKIALDRDGTKIQSWGGAKYKYKKAYENQNYHLLRIMHNPSEYFLVSILSVFNFQIFAIAPAVKSPFSYDY